MRGNEYTELLSFVEVARQRSFRQAAAKLGLTPSALSHTIRALEQRLQVKLLNRTTRSVAPTEAGSLLLERIAPAFEEVSSAVLAVQALQGRPAGSVRLNVPSVAAHMVLAPLLADFCRRYPDIRLDITVEDSLVDIVDGGFDVGIRPGERLHRDMVALRLTPALTTAVVCAPTYLAGRTPPRTPQELGGHACLMYRWRGSQQVYPWPLRRDSEAVDIQFDGAVSSNDIGVLLSACLNGAGIACLARELVAPYLASGALVSLLEDWCATTPGFYLYYPGRQTSAAVRVFIDFMREQASLVP
ncbi:DNA-binding transcriptional LysR family regulator [Duganella sp. 1224]|uniref:LysR family transcriptional regulator n=1 Tax=Duganella sp. 1224 TaxID=2587052 RepID=UPI0015CA465A|nr:LysR family transcriptional regulator [Duganella sp. 1224]NYE62761.1 DNA-binding transcriptional LysR family regulator [Duganella sp. 1224]